ncbi:MAG TPA: hypothetical protein VMI33_10390 [Streptosporangiaceae bacterium]|nr:hypothetical protein [Streptosporangiaceae bacterium]
MTGAVWTRTGERRTWTAGLAGAVLSASRQADGGGWAAQVRWPATAGRAARSATLYGFATRAAAQRWAERQVSP